VAPQFGVAKAQDELSPFAARRAKSNPGSTNALSLLQMVEPTFNVEVHCAISISNDDSDLGSALDISICQAIRFPAK
jgi:hypothetical protein